MGVVLADGDALVRRFDLQGSRIGYLLVDAAADGVHVPPQAVKDGRVVLNIAQRAVARLELGNDWIRFQARFSGQAFPVEVPISAVAAIYAQESGQGMMLPAEDDDAAVAPGEDNDNGDDDNGGSKRPPHLRVVK